MDVASGADRHLLFVSVLFREAISHPYISFFSFTSKKFFCYIAIYVCDPKKVRVALSDGLIFTKLAVDLSLNI